MEETKNKTRRNIQFPTMQMDEIIIVKCDTHIDIHIGINDINNVSPALNMLTEEVEKLPKHTTELGYDFRNRVKMQSRSWSCEPFGQGYVMIYENTECTPEESMMGNTKNFERLYWYCAELIN